MCDHLNMNTSTANIELEWVDHTNSSWSTKDCDNLANRDFVQTIYENLLYNKEVRVVPTCTATCSDVQMLPDFQSELSLPTDLDHYGCNLLLTQLELAKSVCSQTAFSVVLKQRLLILKRIYYALVIKYHDKEKITDSAIYESVACLPREPLISDSHTLIEIGVQTGLTLMFAVLKQNWQTSSILGVPCLCNSVLKTVVDMVEKLPPLSLSNDAKLTNLGVTSLDQVSEFLKEVLNISGADDESKLLSSELLLLLAVQRGSLRYLLGWIEMALKACSANKDQILKSCIFNKVLSQLQANNSSSSNSLCRDSSDDISMYETAVQLMEELAMMSVSYGGACSGTDVSSDSAGTSLTDNDEVYVWGSNSSHQLAEEGVLEKIILPMKSLVFGQAQQVIYVYLIDLD